MRARSERTLGWILALWIAGWSGLAEAQVPRDDAWRADIRQMAEEVTSKHPNFFTRLTREEFDREVNDLLTSVPERSTAEIVIGMQRLLAMAGDGHTAMNLLQAGTAISRLPIRLYWFSDGIYATSASAAYAAILGKRLLAIEDTDVDDAVVRVTPLIAHENDWWVRSQAPAYLTSPEVLQFTGIASKDTREIRLTFEGGSGPIRVSVVPGSATLFSAPEKARPNPPFYRRYADRFYWYEVLNDRAAIYLKYNAAQRSPVLSLAEIIQEAFGAVDPATLRHAVIDLRNNSGGSTLVSEPLLAALQGLKAARVFPMERVFVIIGRDTFSSGLLAAMEMKRLGVTLAGEPTGNKPNHFGEVVPVLLNNSQLIYNHSTKAFSFPDFPEDALHPDLPVSLSSVDYFQERDPVLEAILSR